MVNHSAEKLLKTDARKLLNWSAEQGLVPTLCCFKTMSVRRSNGIFCKTFLQFAASLFASSPPNRPLVVSAGSFVSRPLTYLRYDPNSQKLDFSSFSFKGKEGLSCFTRCVVKSFVCDQPRGRFCFYQQREAVFENLVFFVCRRCLRRSWQRLTFC